MGQKLKPSIGEDMLVVFEHPNPMRLLMTRLPQLTKEHTIAYKSIALLLKDSKISKIFKSNELLKRRPRHIKTLPEKNLYGKTKTEDVGCSTELSRGFGDSLEKF